MGAILQPTPEMGEYRVEIRRKSFYLHGDGDSRASGGDGHAITVYPDLLDPDVGTIEVLLEDVPKLRACLDAIDSYLKEYRRS